QNGFWNADSTVFAQGGQASHLAVYSSTGAIIRSDLPTGDQFINTFDPVDKNAWYYADGANLKRFDLSTGLTTTLKTFPASLADQGDSVDWIDKTGRYFVIVYSGSIHIWDKQTDTVYSGGIAAGFGAGWVGITPSGNYIVTAGTGNGSEFKSY